MEVWRDIKNYEGLYQVSNKGRVRSVDRIVLRKNKHGEYQEFKFKGKILTPFKVNIFYNVVSLGAKNKKLVHRLVAEAFIPNPDNKPLVDHIIPLSNGGTDEITNLRWVTPHENNMNDNTRKNMSIAKTGSVSPMKGKLNREDVSKKILQYSLDGKLVKIWRSTMDVKRKTGFDNGNISRCCNGKMKTYKGYIWSHKPL